jgi:hypothetical protein
MQLCIDFNRLSILSPSNFLISAALRERDWGAGWTIVSQPISHFEIGDCLDASLLAMTINPPRERSPDRPR